jgi:hypothetical protein
MSSEVNLRFFVFQIYENWIVEHKPRVSSRRQHESQSAVTIAERRWAAGWDGWVDGWLHPKDNSERRYVPP